jgi:hypothetical protein
MQARWGDVRLISRLLESGAGFEPRESRLFRMEIDRETL